MKSYKIDLKHSLSIEINRLVFEGTCLLLPVGC